MSRIDADRRKLSRLNGAVRDERTGTGQRANSPLKCPRLTAGNAFREKKRSQPFISDKNRRSGRLEAFLETSISDTKVPERRSRTRTSADLTTVKHSAPPSQNKGVCHGFPADSEEKIQNEWVCHDCKAVRTLSNDSSRLRVRTSILLQSSDQAKREIGKALSSFTAFRESQTGGQSALSSVTNPTLLDAHSQST